MVYLQRTKCNALQCYKNWVIILRAFIPTRSPSEGLPALWKPSINISALCLIPHNFNSFEIQSGTTNHQLCSLVTALKPWTLRLTPRASVLYISATSVNSGFSRVRSTGISCWAPSHKGVIAAIVDLDSLGDQDLAAVKNAAGLLARTHIHCTLL